MLEKTGPIEKIYEAYTAIADDRITMHEDHAEVFSSDRSKSYTVSWKDNVYSSDDSATYWQGYPGYPVIAVLMLQGRLLYDEAIASQFKDINWNKLNKEYKRDYTGAFEHIVEERHLDEETIKKEAETVYAQLKELDITLKKAGKKKKVG